MNLVESYLAVATDSGEPVSAALQQINDELGTSYRINRLYEWRAGSRSIPDAVQRYMLRVAIEQAVNEEGGMAPPDGRLDALAERLCPPARRKTA